MVLLCLLMPVVAGAQIVAVYDAQAVFNAMAEKAQAESQLQALSDQLKAEYQMLQDEFNRKYADYQAIAADAETSASIKERRMQEIQESDKKIRAFQAKADAELKQRRDELTAPLRAAIKAAVKEVGDESNYSLIIDCSQLGVDYRNPSTPDVTDRVKAKLGL